jgi:uncharacterized integral membrane protein
MINRIVGWVVLVPLCLVLVLFALANRHPVVVNANPFTSSDMAPAGVGVPMFLVLYAVLLVGVLLGGIATWFAQGHHRRREKHWRREAQLLSTELETLRRNQGQGQPKPSELDELLELR